MLMIYLCFETLNYKYVLEDDVLIQKKNGSIL